MMTSRQSCLRVILVDEVPMGASTGLTFVRQLEHSIGDDEVVLRAKVEEPETIATNVSDSMFPKFLFLAFCNDFSDYFRVLAQTSPVIRMLNLPRFLRFRSVLFKWGALQFLIVVWNSLQYP